MVTASKKKSKRNAPPLSSKGTSEAESQINKLLHEKKPARKIVNKKGRRSRLSKRAIGPLTNSILDSPDPMYFGPQNTKQKRMLQNWIPQYQLTPVHVNRNNPSQITPFTAAQISQIGTIPKNRKSPVLPRYFWNNYQDIDYIVLQDIYMNTICGRLVDVLVWFVMGRGIKPVLKLNNPDEIEPTAEKSKEELVQEIIDSNKDIANSISSIDNHISDPDSEDPYLDVDFDTKLESLITNSLVFGRSMMTYERMRPVKVNDKSFLQIPDTLKVIHPRDMGFVDVDFATWKLKRVQLRFTPYVFEPDDMLYLEHKHSSPVYNSLHYGFSFMQSMIGAGRTLRRLIEIDFPQIAKTNWSGAALLVYRSKGTTDESKEEEIADIMANFKVGEINADVEDDPQTDVVLHNIDLNPKISELIQMAEFLIKYCIGQTGMPSALFTNEQDTNRDTLLGKIRLFVAGTIKRYRDWIAREVARQWYMKNFRIIYKDNKEILEKFHIEAEFEDIKLESWDDLVSAVRELASIKPLTAQAIGEFLDIPNFESKVDPDGTPSTMNKFTMTNQNGEKSEFELN